MLQLRFEVVSSENINDICTQATRIATAIGVDVVFEHNGIDVVAKPGMSTESLIEIVECLKSPSIHIKGPAEPKDPSTSKTEKEKPGKGGKGKSKPNEPADENTKSATAPEAELQKEGV